MGETFSSYISTFNQSFYDVTNVGIKASPAARTRAAPRRAAPTARASPLHHLHSSQAELQTKSRRITLLDIKATPVPCFQAAENKDFIVQQELEELGTHM